MKRKLPSDHPVAEKKKSVQSHLTKPSDTSEGRTLFIRNISFDATEESFHEFFSQFADIEFAKIVKDPATQHSRGSGFVKFRNADDAASLLLESSQPEHAEKFTMDNRLLQLTMAVPREEATRLRSLHSQTTDKTNRGDGSSSCEQGRNLHLARYGFVRPGTVAAEGLSSQELAMREALFQSKKSKLKDPNIFISELRLCIRNLPLKVDDTELKRACFKLANDPHKCRITECRIMRNRTPGKQENRSLGYAFVAFEEHKHALKVLQALNNNAVVFGGQRHPIVEFSLENKKALEKKKRRADKSAMIQAKQHQDSGPREGWRLHSIEKLLRNPAKNKQKSVKPNEQNNPGSKQRVLPKYFKAKNRRRDKNKPRGSKPKGRLSRNTIRKKKLNTS